MWIWFLSMLLIPLATACTSALSFSFRHDWKSLPCIQMIFKVLVAISDILSVLECFGDTIKPVTIQPADGLYRIQKNNHAVVRRDGEHIVDALEIRSIWG